MTLSWVYSIRCYTLACTLELGFNCLDLNPVLAFLLCLTLGKLFHLSKYLPLFIKCDDDDNFNYQRRLDLPDKIHVTMPGIY